MKPAACPVVWETSQAQVPSGGSAKFQILWQDRPVEGFVVNLAGRYYAYVNYCVHAGTPLDWWPNEFFDDDRRFLICGTHGSRFDPATGQCAGGPCRGASLFRLKVDVIDDRVVVRATEDENKCRAQDEAAV